MIFMALRLCLRGGKWRVSDGNELNCIRSSVQVPRFPFLSLGFPPPKHRVKLKIIFLFLYIYIFSFSQKEIRTGKNEKKEQRMVMALTLGPVIATMVTLTTSLSTWWLIGPKLWRRLWIMASCSLPPSPSLRQIPCSSGEYGEIK